MSQQTEAPPTPQRVDHFTVAERKARGKAERAEVPRNVHAGWEPPAMRRDPVDLLEEQAKTRVPELVPIRYGRMLVSPFTFYRGAAYIMAADLAGTARTGLHTQLCGDAHLSNFGAYAAPDRRLVLDVNDFDETLPGPFEWDVKRLVASFEVAGRDRGFDDKQRRTVNLAAGARVSRGDQRVRGDGQHGDLVLAHRRGRALRVLAVTGDGEAGQAGRGEPRQGTVEGQHARVREADDRSSTASPGS